MSDKKDDKFATLTSADIERALRIGQEEVDKATRKYNNSVAPEPRVGKCRVCNGRVTETHKKEWPTDKIGCGVYGGYWISSGLSCDDCGVMYKKLPNN